jgi:NAD-dependent histone deacetylase SIR2
MGQESSHELIDDSIPPRTLRSRDVKSVAEMIKDGKAPRIVVLTGAGVSTSAGIPDFRSPKTGLYANLARLNLPYAEAVFDISYFRQNPNPFYALARELYPGKYKPTVAHAFVALLARKGLLHMAFTQNIDCLERAAGVPVEKIVEAHGSFATQRCIECHTAFPDDLMLSAVQNGDVPQCVVPQCNGLVKPDIVFFGEPLPDGFRQNMPKVAQANLMIIMGTSLTVQPFASLPGYALEGIPRVLINLERVGGLGSRPDDVCILSECDRGVRDLADALSWREELEVLWKEVSGMEAEGDALQPPLDTRSKDEILEDEIENLTREVDHTLKLSNGHKQYLEDHLGKKIVKGALEKADELEPKVANDGLGADGPSTVSITQDLEIPKVVSKSSMTDTENQRTSESASSPMLIKADVEKPTIGSDQSTTAAGASENFIRADPLTTNMDENKTSEALDDAKSHL